MAILGGGSPPRYVSLIEPGTRDRNRIIVRPRAKWVTQGSDLSPQELPQDEELMIVTPKTVLRTTHYLTPVLYTYGTNGIVIKDILEPRMSHIPYNLTSIGGEAVGKEGEIIGVVYINKNPVDLITGKRIPVRLKDKNATITVHLKKVTLSVANITSFVTKLWARGIESDAELQEGIVERIQWDIKEVAKSYTLDEIFDRADEMMEKVKSIVASTVQEYSLNLVDIVMDVSIPSQVAEYYYWHTIRGMPEEIPYALSVLKDLKENVPELLDEVGPLLVMALISKDENIQKLGESALERILRKELSKFDGESE